MPNQQCNGCTMGCCGCPEHIRPAPSPAPEEWEKRFDEKFERFGGYITGARVCVSGETTRQLVKDFIRSELQKAYEQGKKDAFHLDTPLQMLGDKSVIQFVNTAIRETKEAVRREIEKVIPDGEIKIDPGTPCIRQCHIISKRLTLEEILQAPSLQLSNENEV